MSFSEDFSLVNNDDDGEFEELTTAEVLTQLEQAWRNEMTAPEILSHNAELVEIMLGQLSLVREQLGKSAKGSVSYALHKMEIDRIQYVINSYLRCRLHKIEKFVFAILSDEEERKKTRQQTKLSTEETRFAVDYRSHLSNYLHTQCLEKLPLNARKLNLEEQAARPNLDHYVFLRALQRVPNVAIQKNDIHGIEVDLEPDSQHIMRYDVAAPLLTAKSVQLL